MVKLALLKDVSFKIENSDIKSHLEGKVSFIEFDGTIDLFHKIHDVFSGYVVDIINCHYDDTYLIQGFSISKNTEKTHGNYFLVKRKINSPDQYVYTSENELKENDTFEHVDIEMEDIENILINIYCNKCVQVDPNGELTDLIYKVDYDDKITGTFSILDKEYTTIESFKFIDMEYFLSFQKANNLNETQYSKLMSDVIIEHSIKYLYLRKQFELGLFDCYCPVMCDEKNIILTELFKDTISGKCYVGLENDLEDDLKALHFDKNVFNKLLNFLKSTNKKPKNNLFKNIFYELKDY
jgi:hypothetical protein